MHKRETKNEKKKTDGQILRMNETLPGAINQLNLTYLLREYSFVNYDESNDILDEKPITRALPKGRQSREIKRTSGSQQILFVCRFRDRGTRYLFIALITADLPSLVIHAAYYRRLVIVSSRV